MGRAEACKRQVTRDHRPLCVITSSIRSGAWYLIGLKCRPTLPFSLFLSLPPSFFHFPSALHPPSSSIFHRESLSFSHTLSFSPIHEILVDDETGRGKRQGRKRGVAKGRNRRYLRSGMPKYLTEKMISPHLDFSHCPGTALPRWGWIRFLVEPEATSSPFPPAILVHHLSSAPLSFHATLLLVSTEEGRGIPRFFSLRPFPATR